MMSKCNGIDKKIKSYLLIYRITEKTQKRARHVNNTDNIAKKLVI